MKNILPLLLLIFGIVFVQTSSFAAGPEIWKSGCAYFIDKKVKTEAACTVKVYANATSATEEWEWENGNHTVVKMSDKGIFLNGKAAEKIDASEFLDVEETHCYKIVASGKIYCWGV